MVQQALLSIVAFRTSSYYPPKVSDNTVELTPPLACIWAMAFFRVLSVTALSCAGIGGGGGGGGGVGAAFGLLGLNILPMSCS